MPQNDDLDFRNPNQSYERRSTDDSDAKMLDKILGFERSTHDQIGAVATKIMIIEANQKHVADKMESLVSRLEFTPVKLLVYGMTGIILSTVMAAMVALVLVK